MENNKDESYGAFDERSVEEFVQFARSCIPQRSIDGALYLIEHWVRWAESNEFRDKAMERWDAMDNLIKVLPGKDKNERGEYVNKLISESVPQVFQHFPVWRAKNVRMGGRDISPSELFADPFTCLLTWCGVLGIDRGYIVPGSLRDAEGNYVYPGMLGSWSNLGHVFSNPNWRDVVITAIRKQYNIEIGAGKELFKQIKASQDDLDTLVLLFKRVIVWADEHFNEDYQPMKDEDNFYNQCLYAYNPGIRTMQVRARTAGSVIPVERTGGVPEGIRSARFEYFEKGILGPGSEDISIFYHWDGDQTAIKLATEQKKAEQAGLGKVHREAAIRNLSRYIKRPNIELSEGSFAGVRDWKGTFTLVSDKKVVLSNRDKKIRKIQRGLWVNHKERPFLADCLKDLADSDELSVQEREMIRRGIPNAKRMNEMTSLLHRVERKKVLKPLGDCFADAEERAAEIVEGLLSRGRKLIQE